MARLHDAIRLLAENENPDPKTLVASVFGKSPNEVERFVRDYRGRAEARKVSPDKVTAQDRFRSAASLSAEELRSLIDVWERRKKDSEKILSTPDQNRELYVLAAKEKALASRQIEKYTRRLERKAPRKTAKVA